ncbi:MAG: hypothetical protein A4E61_00411 [Syntrophorhabdus sp. PtaB.Bin184]|nr:MAG: hypothetical protein A4E61_00411 [Syntrophorhabdus sp. PtaB.Bin184]
MYELHRPVLELEGSLGPCLEEAVVYVSLCFGVGQGFYTVCDGYALGKMAHRGVFQLVEELGLGEEDGVEYLLLVCLYVGEKADELQELV